MSTQVSEGSLYSGYKLRLTVTMSSQNAAENYSTFGVTLQIIKGTGSGRWHQGPHYWSIGDGSGVYYLAHGSIASYDFRNYSVLTLWSGYVNYWHNSVGDLSRYFLAQFTDNTAYGATLGNSATDQIFNAPRIARPPTAPTIGEPVQLSMTSFRSVWTPTYNGNGTFREYQVQRSTVSSFPADSRTVTNYVNNSSTHQFEHTGLDPYATYYTRVRALSNNGASILYGGWSTTKTVVLSGPPPTPALTVYDTTTNGFSAKLEYPTVTPAVVDRVMEVSLTPDFSTIVGSSTLLVDSWSGFARGATVYVRGRILNSLGWSEYAYATAYILVGKPSAPTGYFVTDIARTSARLSLGSVADNGGASIAQLRYQLEHNSGLVEDRTVTSYVPVWMNLGTQTPVARRVRMMVANSGTGWQWSDWGAWVSFNANTSVPHAPVATFAATGDTTAVLDWDEPTGLGTVTVLGYRIRIGLDPELASPGVVEISKSSTARSHTFDGLQPGTTYYVQIYATSSAGPGSRTVPALFDTTSGVAPSAKSFWLRVGGVYRPGDIFIKVAGVWKKATPWQKIEGTWRKF